MRTLARWAFAVGALACLALLMVAQLQAGSTWRTSAVRGIYFSADRGVESDSVMLLSDATYYPVADTAGNVVYMKAGGTVMSVTTRRKYMTSDNATIRAYPSTASDTTGQGVDCTYEGGTRYEWYIESADFGVYDFYEIGGDPDSAISRMELRFVVGGTAPDSFVTTTGLEDAAVDSTKIASGAVDPIAHIDTLKVGAFGGLRIAGASLYITQSGDSAKIEGKPNYPGDVSFGGDVHLGDDTGDMISVWGSLQTEHIVNMYGTSIHLYGSSIEIGNTPSDSVLFSAYSPRYAYNAEVDGDLDVGGTITGDLTGNVDAELEGEGSVATDALTTGTLTASAAVNLNGTTALGNEPADSLTVAAQKMHLAHNLKADEAITAGTDLIAYDDLVVTADGDIGGSLDVGGKLTAEGTWQLGNAATDAGTIYGLVTARKPVVFGVNLAGYDGRLELTDGAYALRVRSHPTMTANATYCFPPAENKRDNAILVSANADSLTDWQYFEHRQVQFIDTSSYYRMAIYKPGVTSTTPCTVHPNVAYGGTLRWPFCYCVTDSLIIWNTDGTSAVTTGPAGYYLTYTIGTLGGY